MIDLRHYDPAGWPQAIADGAWTQAELDEAVEHLRGRRVYELLAVVHAEAETLNPVLSHPVAIELLKLLQPLLPQELTPELQAAVTLEERYTLARADIDTMAGEDLYYLNVKEAWNV
jgi:hypothetical protein